MFWTLYYMLLSDINHCLIFRATVSDVSTITLLGKIAQYRMYHTTICSYGLQYYALGDINVHDENIEMKIFMYAVNSS